MKGKKRNSLLYDNFEKNLDWRLRKGIKTMKQLKMKKGTTPSMPPEQ